MDYSNIIWAFVWFIVLGAAMGAMLALASKIFAIKVDPRVEKIVSVLPAANCGGCGYAGCEALAVAIAKGDAPPNACTAGGLETAQAVAEIMGVPAVAPRRMRAQVMCSGTQGKARLKYNYSGPMDCNVAMKLAGGDKLCPYGCIGHGTCMAACKFGAIDIKDGVAVVDYKRCRGCGMCASACPKHVIKLVPYESDHWVSCNSTDDGKMTRSYCDVGCIACKLCEKVCEYDAIHVKNNLAEIDYSKCTSCGKCVLKCPRKIILHSRDPRAKTA